MPDQQYVSSDPNAGSEYLSTDPNAGQPMRQPPVMTAAPSRRFMDRIYMSPSREHELGLARKPVYDRPDNSLLGVPPELAVASAVPVASAVASGTGMAGKAVAGATAAAGQVAPAIKYEAVKTGLEQIGVPSAIAVTIALATSGYAPTKKPTPRAPRQAKPAPTASEPAPVAPAVSAAPAAAAPAAAAPPPPPAARGTAQTPPAAPSPARTSPQRVQNELGLAARRSNVQLTEPEYAEAAALVTQGQTPADAVAAVAGRQSAAPVATVKPPPRMRLNPDEAREYARLVQGGKSDLEAKLAIAQQRQLAASLGTKSPATVRQEVAERNATGRWPERK